MIIQRCMITHLVVCDHTGRCVGARPLRDHTISVCDHTSHLCDHTPLYDHTNGVCVIIQDICVITHTVVVTRKMMCGHTIVCMVGRPNSLHTGIRVTTRSHFV